MGCDDLMLGLDLGTSSCKVLAVTRAGDTVAIGNAACPVITVGPGIVEQDAHAVWRACVQALEQVVRQVDPGQIAGLCLSGAMHTLLLVDARGQLLNRSLTWADSRAGSVAAQLRQQVDVASLYHATGCPLNSFYHPARLRWFQQHQPDLWRTAQRIVSIKDFILFQLTRVWATDLSLASTTGLLDTRTGRWHESALACAGVRPQQLPPLVDPRSRVGSITPAVAAATQLPAGLPVFAGASDGPLANVGAGAARLSGLVITIGTSGAMRALAQQPQLDPQQRTWCYLLLPNLWVAGGAINSGGLVLQWVRERFYHHLPAAQGYQQLLDDVTSVDPGAEGLSLVPYLAGERTPYWNPDLRAAVHGLALHHERRHLARAALESVAFALADVRDALPTGLATSNHATLTGGITRSRGWAQIICDVLGIELALTEAADASAHGAARLGWLALGEEGPWQAPVSEDTFRISPEPAHVAFYAQRFVEWQRLYGLAFENEPRTK